LDCCLSAAFVKSFVPLLGHDDYAVKTIVCGMASSYGTINLATGSTLGAQVTEKMASEHALTGATRTFKLATGTVVPPQFEEFYVDDTTPLSKSGTVWSTSGVEFDFVKNPPLQAKFHTWLDGQQATMRVTQAYIAHFFSRAIFVANSLGAGRLYHCGVFRDAASETAAFNAWEGAGGGNGVSYTSHTAMRAELARNQVTCEALAFESLKSKAKSLITAKI